jgi:signal peptidase II
MRKIGKSCLLVLATAFANIFADRVTKNLAELYLKGRDNLVFFDGVFVLCYAENTGAFLSLGRNWPIPVKYAVLLIIPILVCLCVIAYCAVKEKKAARIVLLMTIVSGGLSNLGDRLFNDFAVIDFMNFGMGRLRTGILNVADLSVTFGMIVFVLYEIAEDRKRKDVSMVFIDDKKRKDT